MLLRPYFLAVQWILLFCIFNPFFFTLLSSSYTTYDLQRILELGLLTFLSIHLFIDTEFRCHTFHFLENLCSYQKLLIALFFGLGILSAIHAMEPRYGLMQVTTFFMLMLFLFSIAGWYSLQKEFFLKSFEFFLFFTFTVSAIVSIGTLTYLLNNSLPASTPDRTILTILASPGYMNLRFFDDVQAFLIPILIGLFFYVPQQWKKALVFLLISFSITRGILGGSRLYLYEAIAIFVILPLLFRKKTVTYLILLISSIVAGFVLYILFYKWGFMSHSETAAISFLNGKGLSSLDNRGLLWQIAGNLIRLHPFVGVGPLHYGLYAYSIENYAAHPHNSFLALSSEWGIPAFLALVILGFSALFALYQRAQEDAKDIDKSYFLIGFIGALIGGGLMMSIDGLPLMPAGQMMLCLTIGILISRTGIPPNKAVLSLASKFFDLNMRIFIGFALALMAWGLFPLVFHLPAMTVQYLAECSFNCSLSPDYWSQGFIQFY